MMRAVGTTALVSFAAGQQAGDFDTNGVNLEEGRARIVCENNAVTVI